MPSGVFGGNPSWHKADALLLPPLMQAQHCQVPGISMACFVSKTAFQAGQITAELVQSVSHSAVSSEKRSTEGKAFLT